MTFEIMLKQIVKEAVAEAIKENIGNIIVNASKEPKPKVETVLFNNESEEPKNWGTNESEEIIQEHEEVETEIDEVDLGSMKLKELREYAEELGLNPKGKRAEVEERIQEFLDNQEETEEETEEVEEPEDDSEDLEETEEAEEEVEDETYAKVMEYVNEASDEELRETLEELGLSSKGKREALIEKIYQAVKDGLFEFEEESEEPSEEVESEEESEDFGMTEARLKALEAMEIQVQEEFEEGKITRKEMVDYLKQVGIAVTKKVEDEAVVEMYTEKLALLVDDEGEFHDEGGDPYTINEVPYCCGAPLEEIEGGYKCNVCGTEYEAE